MPLIQDLIHLQFVHFILKFLSFCSPYTLQDPINMEQSQYEMYIREWNVVTIVLKIAKPTFECHPRLHEAQANKMMTRKVKRYFTSFGNYLNVIQ
jgi:hypothetical protein